MAKSKINDRHPGPINFATSAGLRKVNQGGTKTYEADMPKMGRPVTAFRSWGHSAHEWYEEQCCSNDLHAARFLCGGYPK